MTRNDHREACIKAMAIAAYEADTDNYDGPWEERLEYWRNIKLKLAAAAFDSLHGRAWVVTGPFQSSIIAEVLDAADLTNPPESKP
jgi:hypothetical protein